MKIARSFGYIGLAVVALGAAVPAVAQSGYYQRDDRGAYQDGRGYNDRGYEQRGYEQRGYDDRRYDDRGRHYGWDRDHRRGWGNDRPRCRTVWRYERPYRICR
jgi:hypothetical protein